MPYASLPSALNALDVLILPSRTTPHWKEQFGRVLIEAGACGVPVIGSDSGAIPEVIGEAGLIFPEGRVTALVEAIRRLRENEAMRKRMGAAGRRRAETLFSWEAVAAQMAAIYRTMLS
jgi:glycosyltransferase involved in cell wall biosynthesis